LTQRNAEEAGMAHLVPERAESAMRLNAAECTAVLEALPGWTLAPGQEAIAKSFVFGDFSAAFAFMTRGAIEAEAMNHHPDWRNVYNRVEVLLTTHDAGGLTQKDIMLAQRLDALAGR
jgi:4a-hydroxytetrahydrobiopterin dehydratase